MKKWINNILKVYKSKLIIMYVLMNRKLCLEDCNILLFEKIDMEQDNLSYYDFFKKNYVDMIFVQTMVDNDIMDLF